MSAKNLKKKNEEKKGVSKEKSDDLMDYLDTEKLEEKLLGELDSLDNIGYILENIASSKEGAGEKMLPKSSKKPVAVKSPQKELDELEGEMWNLEEDMEGELSLDVYDEGDVLVIQAPVAGVALDDIDINYSQGVLTIKGERKNEKIVKQDQYLTSECYWGKFSRSIFLPVEIDTKKIKAYLKNGILIVNLPKLDLPANVDIEVKKA